MNAKRRLCGWYGFNGVKDGECKFLSLLPDGKGGGKDADLKEDKQDES